MGVLVRGFNYYGGKDFVGHLLINGSNDFLCCCITSRTFLDFPNVSVGTGKYGTVGEEDPSLVRGRISYLGTLDG
jgi:hypothetical protein